MAREVKGVLLVIFLSVWFGLIPAIPADAQEPTPTLTATPSPTRRPLPDTTNGIHVFNDQLSGQLTPEQITFCATHYAGTQKMTRASADSLRAVNPGFIILHYRLGLGLGFRSTGEGCAPTGGFLHIINTNWVQEWPGDDIVQNSWFYLYGGQRVLNCTYGWYVMNLEDTSWREWWTGQVLEQLENNDDDGLFADSLSIPSYLGANTYNPVLPAYDPTFESGWADRIQDFIDYVQTRFGGRYYLIPNAGSWVTTRDPTDYSDTDGVMIEGFGYDVWESYGETDWKLQMNRCLGLINAGKCLIGQSYRTESVETRMFDLGSYLLIKGSKTYINLEEGFEPEWWPEYEIPLGTPSGSVPTLVDDLYNSGWGVFSRSYSNGLVLVNTSGSPRLIDFGGTYSLAQPNGGGSVPGSEIPPSEWRVEYTEVSQVTLQPGRAAILVIDPSPKPEPTPTPTEASTGVSGWGLF
jgi:hypothetical protein